MAAPKRIHIIGKKNSGKTTLLVELVQHFTARGVRVGTIKHTHHSHELDTPGKDSQRHRQAGAQAAAILSPRMVAVFWPTDPEASDRDPYERLGDTLADCELVLVEGDVQAAAPRIEVWRSAIQTPPYAQQDGTIKALVTDDEVAVAVPIWRRADIPTLADSLLEMSAGTSGL